MLISHCQKKLAHWGKQMRTRKRIVISDRDNNKIIANGTECINFCSNDYLGLTNHPALQAAFIKGVTQYGFGSGASSFMSGYFDIQQELESRFANWMNVDKAILFNSGYLANIGSIGSLTNRSSTIISDKLCHASLLDGIQLSRCKHYRFHHQSMTHLTNLLRKHKTDFIVTESVFSMEGDISFVQEITQLAKQYNASVIIDDAHGIGVLGEYGRGICEYAKINQDQFACLISPLGKAFNGIGAMVCGREPIIESILQFSKTYRYTTALPPAICSALLAALDVIMTEHWRRYRLNELILFFIKAAQERGLILTSAELTPIKSIIIDQHRLLPLQEALLKNGFLISCVRPPTVPEGTARVRVSLNCFHTEEQITQLLDYIVPAFEIASFPPSCHASMTTEWKVAVSFSGSI